MKFDPPIFRQVASDSDLSARETQVFWAATELLDVADWRPMTLTAMESQILNNQRAAGHEKPRGVPRSTIAAALNRLVAIGYLCRAIGNDGRELYRVPLSRESAMTGDCEPQTDRRRAPRVRLAGVVSEVLSSE